MRWQTKTNIPVYPFKLDLNQPTLFLGSCFAENISEKFHAHFLPHTINPFGITYNPLIIQRHIDYITQKKEYTAADLEFYNERYFSFDHHSQFSHSIRAKALEKINQHIQETAGLLPKYQAIIISLGTSFYWTKKADGTIVNNCHKLPGNQFIQKLATPQDITHALERSINAIRKNNPNAPIIFTVSPVRHLKQGSIQNQLSKSNLIVAVHQIIQQTKNTFYFPSYELLLDDLRDYRFYEEDLLHPSKEAINYIWDYVVDSLFKKEDSNTLNRLSLLKNAQNHRPFNPNSEGYQKHLKWIEKESADLEKLTGLKILFS